MSQLRDLKSVIAIQQPKTLVFGAGCAGRCPDDLAAKGFRRVFVVSSPSVVKMAEPLLAALRGKLAHVAAYSDIRREPTIAMFEATLRAARDFSPDCVVGIGGGSPLDVAKLVAALHSSSQSVAEVFGIGKLATRSTHLACLPTTAGTGSEVSPNAILLDESAQLKKGVISPHLMPEATYADPQLTLTVPPNVTAATGLDALTHCIEAYVNKLAHPMIDLYALEGIRLIGRSLGARSITGMTSTLALMSCSAASTAACVLVPSTPARSMRCRIRWVANSIFPTASPIRCCCRMC